MKPQDIIGELLPDNDQFRLALPIGSLWAVYNHTLVRGVPVGPVGVYRIDNHHPAGLKLKNALTGEYNAIPYPFVNEWKIDKGHIRLGTADAGLMLTFAPA